VTLVLALDTSSRTYAVAVGRKDRPAAERRSTRQDPAFAGLGDMVAQALSDAGESFQDLAGIGVDIGPGGLPSIRAAVAYANGLAFSLGVRIFPVGSLELLAMAARPKHQDPILCLKPGQNGNVYAGLFINGENTELRHGPPATVVPAIVNGLDRLCLAGTDIDGIASLLPAVTVVSTGITEADVTILYKATRVALAADPERLVSSATPLNESSRAFHNSAAL
jgi:tRNA threonylcarbamoyl adenosine modification protein YeaZ